MYKGIYWIFLFVLLFFPLAFGTVELWSLVLMMCLTSAASFMLLLRNARRHEPPLYEVPGIVPLLCLLAYMVLQIIPLPPPVLRFLSPGTYALYRDTVGALDPSAWLSLSVYKKGTFLELVRYASYALFYVLTVQVMSRGRLLKRTVAAVVVFASVLSFLSILQHFVTPDRVLWFRPLTAGGNPFGPYVNRNHYAGFMNMVLPVIMALLLVYKPRISYKSFREKLAEIFTQRRTNIHVLLMFSAVLAGTSVFVTLSRGGIVSLCLSMLLLGLFIIRRERKRGMVVMAVFAFLFLSVGWFGWSHVFERFAEIRGAGDIANLRFDIWKESLDIIKRFPLFGTGFGTFERVFMGADSMGNLAVDHAHNDYLELLASSGIIGLALIAWFVAAVLARTFKTLSKRVEPYSVFLAFGAVAGMVSVMFHGLMDFNLQIGANGLYFFFLSGLAVSAANTRLRKGHNRTYLGRKPDFSVKPLALTAVFLATILTVSAGIFAGRYFYCHVEDVWLSGRMPGDGLEKVRKSASRAALFDPLEAKYRFARANAEVLLDEKEAAFRHYREAIELDPLNGGFLQRLGWLFASGEDLMMAGKMLQAGVSLEPRNPRRHKEYALWLFTQNERDRGRQHIKQGVSLEPQNTRDYITFMLLNGMSNIEMLGALPAMAIPHVHYGDFLMETGNEKAAEDAYLKALELVRKDDGIGPGFYYKLSAYYTGKKRYEDALAVMHRAAEVLPRNAGIRLTSGALYERMGITYRAVEEYRKALVIDPHNRAAKKRLRDLDAEGGGL